MAKRAARTGDVKVAIGYARVSTTDQALGLDAQRAEVERWAAREGVRVVAWHVDHGVSGAAAVDARPGLMAALADVEQLGAGLLAVAKRDRLARDVVVAATAEGLARGLGARIVSADGAGAADGPEGALMRTILDAFGAYERALIRARTKRALGVKRERGERVGGIPYGRALADDGKALVPAPDEEATITRARELRAAGLSLSAVGRALADEGRVSRVGRTFVAAQVARMVA